MSAEMWDELGRPFTGTTEENLEHYKAFLQFNVGNVLEIGSGGFLGVIVRRDLTNGEITISFQADPRLKYRAST